MAQGILKQVIGPTIDVEFPPKELPNILNAIKIQDKEGKIDLTAEVAMHLGENTVRCIALSSTDGLVRGMRAIDTGAPITVPVGKETLGRIFNLLGEPLDQLGPISDSAPRSSIHRDPPPFDEQETKTSILETGIKVI